MKVSKEDTYIAPAGIGGMWKFSLHGDEAWQCAVTSEHLASGDEPVWNGADRAPWVFHPPPFHHGVRLAFVICTFRGALRPVVLDPRDTHIRVNDRWDEATQAQIWMTEPGIEFERGRHIGGPLTLKSGRRVWVTAETEAIGGGEPEPGAVSSMLEPIVPKPGDHPTPEVLHRGVFISRADGEPDA